ncbi:YerC/YecD family TrpR-related protein [Gottschalkiaceae bacterium SANA]|nr:YerC/YecD family TrpR-related protein [Gottschalkiaceae bacterium SANA]
MHQTLTKEQKEILFSAILKLKNLEECHAFFDDVCTINELMAMAQRFEIAKLLYDGATFHEVENDTGASSTTISRVSRCLKYGQGYTTVLKRQEDSV